MQKDQSLCSGWRGKGQNPCQRECHLWAHLPSGLLTAPAPRSLGCQAHSAPVIAASGPHSDPSFPSLLPPLHPPGLVLRPHTRELPRRPHHRSAQPLSLPGHRLPLQLQGVLRTLSLPSWLPHEPSSQMRSLVGAEAQRARTTDGRREGAGSQPQAPWPRAPPPPWRVCSHPRPMMEAHHSKPRFDPLKPRHPGHPFVRV